MRQTRNVARVLLLLAAFAAPLALARPLSATTPRSFALLVNGDDSETHQRNVEIALRSLAELGFDGDRILLLSPSPVDGPRAPGWQARARRRELSAAFAELASRLGPEDLLLVYLTGHGYRRFGGSVLALERGTIGARDLADELAKLRFGRLVLVADQCYSGGFLAALGDERRPVVALAATDADHEVHCVPFIRPFWRAATDPRWDRDGDGQVSVEEAFAVAEASARRLAAEHPAAPRLIHTTPVPQGGSAFVAAR